MRSVLVILALLFAPLCSFSVTFDPVLPGQGEPTPTAEIMPTGTPIRYLGSVTPHSQTVNLRGCRIVNDKLCPVVDTLKLGRSLNVLEIDNDLGFYKVEIPGIGTAWVAKQVVTFRPN